MRRTVICRRLIASNFLKDVSERQTLKEAQATHQAAGEDIAANLTSNFVSLQFQLVPYRVVRCAAELEVLRKSPKDFFADKWFAATTIFYVLLAYGVAYLLARRSFSGLLYPPTD